ncbi:MAG: efflux RND transporter permease subunit, partial [Cyanobacteria bacterium P01_C01_bin.118]
MVRPFYRNIRLLVLTIVMIMVWGFVSFQSLPRQEDPELVSRVAVVQTAFPGANAERVEALVTEVIEAELSELEEIDVLSSDSRVGFSTITVELSESIVDAQPVWSKVRDELDDAAARLPNGASEPDLDEAFVKAYTMIASLTWQLPTEPNYGILRRYGEELALRLRGTTGTEEVELFGDPAEEIVVEVDAPSLTAVGLSPQALASRIQTSDAKVTAGQLRSAEQNLAIEVEGELETLDQIRQIAIQSGDGQFTRLSDIAQVYRDVQQPLTDLSLVSGKPAIVAGVMMESGMRIDFWAKEVRAVLADFEAQLPQGMSLDVVFDQSNYVEARISKLLGNLVLGALLVVGVTLFTMGWRAALVVGTALPITSLAVFGWMTVFGVPIHQMSVTGLIIALGLLIDNAIIAVDEIQVELQQGHRPIDAVAKTVDYLKVPLFASTVTTVMTFLPIYLLPGAAGEFVGTIALGVIVALISSLALSLTVISALAGRML